MVKCKKDVRHPTKVFVWFLGRNLHNLRVLGRDLYNPRVFGWETTYMLSLDLDPNYIVCGLLILWALA